MKFLSRLFSNQTELATPTFDEQLNVCGKAIADHWIKNGLLSDDRHKIAEEQGIQIFFNHIEARNSVGSYTDLSKAEVVEAMALFPTELSDPSNPKYKETVASIDALTSKDNAIVKIKERRSEYLQNPGRSDLFPAQTP